MQSKLRIEFASRRNSNRKLCLNVCRPRMIINLNYGEFRAISRENAVQVMSEETQKMGDSFVNFKCQFLTTILSDT